MQGGVAKLETELRAKSTVMCVTSGQSLNHVKRFQRIDEREKRRSPKDYDQYLPKIVAIRGNNVSKKFSICTASLIIHHDQ